MSSLRVVGNGRLAGILAAALLISFAADAHAATGTIRGRVLDGRTDNPKAGVKVILTGARKDGIGRIRRVTLSDRSGRYRFDGLPATKKRVYALDAQFQNGLFAGGVVSLTPARSVFDTTLRVWPTTDDPNSILIESNNLFISPGEGGLDVLESVKVANTSQRAYIGRGPGEATARPTLGFALPAGAEDGGVQITSSDLDVPQLVRAEYGFAITAAVPPGDYLITFAYRVPGSGGSYDLSRTALYPVINAAVHATEPLEVNGPRLHPQSEVTIRGRRYRRWATADALDPGDPLQIGVVAQGSGSPGLMLGVVGAGVLAAGILSFAFVRRRSATRPATPASTQPTAETREHVVSLIAALDLRHRAGDVPDDEYRRKRKELKDLLTELSTPEHTR